MSVKKWAYLHVHEALTLCLALQVRESGFEDFRVVLLDYRPYVHYKGCADWVASDETTAFSSIKKISRIYWTSTFGHVMGVLPLRCTGTGKFRRCYRDVPFFLQ